MDVVPLSIDELEFGAAVTLFLLPSISCLAVLLVSFYIDYKIYNLRIVFSFFPLVIKRRIFFDNSSSILSPNNDDCTYFAKVLFSNDVSIVFTSLYKRLITF